MPRATLAQRLDAKTDKSAGADGCWLYTGGLNRDGYGRISFAHTPLRAHRVAWIVAYGPVPDGKHVCHACDNRACVNPRHLWLGDHDANMADLKRKGRRLSSPLIRGERNGRSMVTEHEVRLIRADKRPQAQVAADYNIHPTTVAQIRLRKTWLHVKEV